MDWTVMTLEILRDEIYQCDFCELRKNIKDEQPLPFKGDGKIMFVTPAPNFDNLSLGQHFSINEQYYFERVLKAADIDSYSLTSITKCSYDKDNKKNRTCKDLCATKYLLREIREIEPKVIVTMGKIPTCHFLKTPISKFKLSDYVHKIYEVDYNDTTYRVLPTYGMAYLMQQGRKKTDDFIAKLKEIG